MKIRFRILKHLHFNKNQTYLGVQLSHFVGYSYTLLIKLF
jgi:hypothetical protein